MIRAYDVFYSALIFVYNAYSYDTRIRMIRAFIWYAYSYDTRVRRWYAYSDIRLIMICVWYTYYTGKVCYNIRERYFTFWDLSYFCLKNEYNEDKFNGRMQCSERRKCHFLASNFKKFPQSLPTCTNCQKLENDKHLLRNELIAIKEKLKLHLSKQGNNVCMSLIYGGGGCYGGHFQKEVSAWGYKNWQS